MLGTSEDFFKVSLEDVSFVHWLIPDHDSTLKEDWISSLPPHSSEDVRDWLWKREVKRRKGEAQDEKTNNCLGLDSFLTTSFYYLVKWDVLATHWRSWASRLVNGTVGFQYWKETICSIKWLKNFHSLKYELKFWD